jgi:Fur family ferric uptake transcriptional regulator
VHRSLLKEADLKATKRREAVLALLERSHTPMTAEEIHQAVIAETSMSLSTTYRILAALSEKRLLLKNIRSDGKTYYQPNSNQHLHYLVCSCCSRIVPIDCCPLEALEEELAKKTGFLITGHSLEFTGLCPACAAAQKAKK